MPWDVEKDLSGLKSIEDLRAIYKRERPNSKGILAEQHIGQIARFLFDLKPGDYVITPSFETEHIYHGILRPEPYYYNTIKDGCPFPHRRAAWWDSHSIPTVEFSENFQNNMRSSMTIFPITKPEDFLEVVSKNRFTKEDLKM